jgi:hypothetical protein
MQITLEPNLQQRARNAARRKGISVAEYVRRLIKDDLGDTTKQADVSSIFALGDSGGSHVGRDKDAMVAEAIDPRRRARRTKR